MSGDGRWMTYDELAKLRGIARPSAERLVQRNRWRRQRGNDRTVRILVPMDSLSDDMSDDVSGDVSADTGLLASTFETALAAIEAAHARELATLKEQVDGAEQAQARALAMVEQFASAARDAEEAARVERARSAAEIADERARADALRDRLTTMQEQLADAHAALQAAESADARAVRAEQDKERAEASRDTERQRADRAEQGREADRARSDVLQAKLDDVQVQLTARQEVIDATEAIRKADDARLARGRWARLRAAWKGK
jgi:chromosome segregation ATPase